MPRATLGARFEVGHTDPTLYEVVSLTPPPSDRAPSSLRLLSVGVVHASNVVPLHRPGKRLTPSGPPVQCGEIFRACRKVLGWTQHEAAKRWGATVRTIRRWEKTGDMPAKAYAWIVAESDRASGRWPYTDEQIETFRRTA